MFIRFVSKDGGLVISDSLRKVSLVLVSLSSFSSFHLSNSVNRRELTFISTSFLIQAWQNKKLVRTNASHRPSRLSPPPPSFFRILTFLPSSSQTFFANFIQSPLVLISLLAMAWGFNYLIRLMDPFYLPAPVRPVPPPLPLSLNR